MKAPQELVELSRKVGKEIPHWVQGTGANLSLKLDDTLWIKQSGTRLDAVSQDQGLVPISNSRLLSTLEKIASLPSNAREQAYNECLRRASLPGFTGRPSMESALHAICPSPWVLHFHSCVALLMGHHSTTEREAFHSWMKRHWKKSFDLVHAAIPGWNLYVRVSEIKNTALILLQNHGVLLQDETPSILEEWKHLEQKFCADWKYDLKFSSKRPNLVKIYFPDSAVFLERLTKAASGRSVDDKDANEILAATELLYRACPNLEEIPEVMAAEIRDLPVEIYRSKLAK